MKVIGLTGSSGSGKSTVSAMLGTHGFYIIDCDQIARAVLRPETNCLKEIFVQFGETVKNADGSLNRKALAEIVFSSPEQLKRLDAIMYPQITADIRDILSACAKNGEQCVILDAPTLFESGADSLCKQVVSVLSEDTLRIKRIMARDSLTAEEAQKRLAAQQANDFYAERSDFIVTNNGSLQALEAEVAALAKQLKE